MGAAQQKLKIITLNVNGLRDAGARNRLCTLFRAKQAGVIFIQETHYTGMPEARLSPVTPDINGTHRLIGRCDAARARSSGGVVSI